MKLGKRTLIEIQEFMNGLIKDVDASHETTDLSSDNLIGDREKRL